MTSHYPLEAQRALRQRAWVWSVMVGILAASVIAGFGVTFPLVMAAATIITGGLARFFLGKTGQVALELDGDSITVRNTFRTHELTWADVGSLDDDNVFIFSALGLKVVAFRGPSGDRGSGLGIDATAGGFDEPLIDRPLTQLLIAEAERRGIGITESLKNARKWY